MPKTTKKSPEEQLEELNKIRGFLHDELQVIQGKLTKNYNQIKKTQSVIDSKKLNNFDSYDIEEKVKFFLEFDQHESDKKYQWRQKFFRDLGFLCDGYYPTTMQNGISIKLKKGCQKSFSETVYGLKIFIPHIKPQVPQGKIIKIFEHTLSENGVYQLIINDSKFAIVKTTFGRQRDVAVFPTLEEAVKYIQDKHWYE